MPPCWRWEAGYLPVRDEPALLYSRGVVGLVRVHLLEVADYSGKGLHAFASSRWVYSHPIAELEWGRIQWTH